MQYTYSINTITAISYTLNYVHTLLYMHVVVGIVRININFNVYCQKGNFWEIRHGGTHENEKEKNWALILGWTVVI